MASPRGIRQTPFRQASGHPTRLRREVKVEARTGTKNCRAATSPKLQAASSPPPIWHPTRRRREAEVEVKVENRIAAEAGGPLAVELVQQVFSRHAVPLADTVENVTQGPFGQNLVRGNGYTMDAGRGGLS